jgi:hypothetical protein
MVDTPNTEVRLQLTGTTGPAETIVNIPLAFEYTPIVVQGTTNATSTEVLVRSSASDVWIWFGNLIFVDASDSINFPLDSWTRGGLLGNITFELQRSTDQETWTDVSRIFIPGMETGTVDLTTIPIPSDTQELVGVNDYEIPVNVQVWYRLRVVANVSGMILGGNWLYTSVIEGMYADTIKWLFKAPFNPALNYQFDMKAQSQDGSFGRKSTEQAAFFNPIGRTRSVKVTDTIQGDVFSLTAMLTSLNDALAWEALRDYQGTILIVSPDNRQWYTAFQNAADMADIVIADPFYREYTATFEEQDAPS